jgi:hypothetical protein
MSAPIHDGGPAFPHNITVRHPCNELLDEHLKFDGMTLRDWFAGQALPAKIADAEAFNDSCRASNISTRITHDYVAQSCYRYADAMLAARKEQAQ